jgi:hypothetical protein
MADNALFIGWGEPVFGREAKSLDVFNETLQYYGQLQNDGRIESFEVVLLDPHGGDLGGFILLRGSRENLAALRGEDEFRRRATQASLVVQSFGIVDAVLENGVASEMGTYASAIDDIG